MKGECFLKLFLKIKKKSQPRGFSARDVLVRVAAPRWALTDGYPVSELDIWQHALEPRMGRGHNIMGGKENAVWSIVQLLFPVQEPPPRLQEPASVASLQDAKSNANCNDDGNGNDNENQYVTIIIGRLVTCIDALQGPSATYFHEKCSDVMLAYCWHIARWFLEHVWNIFCAETYSGDEIASYSRASRTTLCTHKFPCQRPPRWKHGVAAWLTQKQKEDNAVEIRAQ